MTIAAVSDGLALFAFCRFDGTAEVLFKIFVRRFGITGLFLRFMTEAKTVHYRTFQILATTLGVQALAWEARTDEYLEVMANGRTRIQKRIGHLLTDSAVDVSRIAHKRDFEELALGIVANRANAGRLYLDAFHVHLSSSVLMLHLDFFYLY